MAGRRRPALGRPARLTCQAPVHRTIANPSKRSGKQFDGEVGIAVESVGAGADRFVLVEPRDQVQEADRRVAQGRHRLLLAGRLGVVVARIPPPSVRWYRLFSMDLAHCPPSDPLCAPHQPRSKPGEAAGSGGRSARTYAGRRLRTRRRFGGLLPGCSPPPSAPASASTTPTPP